MDGGAKLQEGKRCLWIALRNYGPGGLGGYESRAGPLKLDPKATVIFIVIYYGCLWPRGSRDFVSLTVFPCSRDEPSVIR